MFCNGVGGFIGNPKDYSIQQVFERFRQQKVELSADEKNIIINNYDIMLDDLFEIYLMLNK